MAHEVASGALAESLEQLFSADARVDALLESTLGAVSRLQAALRELVAEGELPAQLAFFRCCVAAASVPCSSTAANTAWLGSDCETQGRSIGPRHGCGVHPRRND